MWEIKVLQALRENKRMSGPAIASKIGFQGRSIFSLLQQLEEQGLIKSGTEPETDPKLLSKGIERRFFFALTERGQARAILGE